MASKRLEVIVSGDVKKLTKGLKGVQSRMKRFGKAMAKAGKVVAVGLGSAGAAAVGAAFKFAATGDRIAKTARTVGFGIEAFQELEFALGQFGLSTEETEKVLRKFNKRIGDAAQGEGTAARAVERLNVSLRDQQGQMRDQDAIFTDVIKKLEGMESSQERAAAAADFFGDRAGPKLATAIESGEEGIEELRQKAQDLGAVMSEETALKAEKFQDALDDVKKAAGGLLRKAITPLMGFLADDVFPFIRDKMIPTVKEWAKEIGPKLQRAMEVARKFIREQVIPAVGDFIGKVREFVEEWGPPLRSFLEKAVPKVGAAARKALQVVGNALGFISRNSETLIPIAATLLSGLLAYKAVIGVQKGIVLATQAWTAAQSGLNIALAANPVGIVVASLAALAAGLVIAWQRSQKFREIVSKAWFAVQDVVRSSIDAVLGGIENMINIAIGAVNKLIRQVNRIPKVEIGEIGTVSLPKLGPRKKTVVRPGGQEIRGLQRGGRFDAGELVLVGEAGPELARFDRPGTVLPDPDSLAPVGGGGGLHVHIGRIVVEGSMIHESEFIDYIGEELVRKIYLKAGIR